MVRTCLGVALLVAAGLTFAGCSKSAAPAASGASPSASVHPSASARASGSARPGTSAAPSTATDPCALVEQTLAAEFVGAAVEPPQLSDRGDATVCVYAARGNGPGTLGLTVYAALATSRSLPAVASAAPDARAVAGLDDALVATGAAWFVVDRHLMNLVLVHPDGALANSTEMRDLVRAIRTSVAAGS